jgi:hypothetical protein
MDNEAARQHRTTLIEALGAVRMAGAETAEDA